MSLPKHIVGRLREAQRFVWFEALKGDYFDLQGLSQQLNRKTLIVDTALDMGALGFLRAVFSVLRPEIPRFEVSEVDLVHLIQEINILDGPSPIGKNDNERVQLTLVINFEGAGALNSESAKEQETLAALRFCACFTDPAIQILVIARFSIEPALLESYWGYTKVVSRKFIETPSGGAPLDPWLAKKKIIKGSVQESLNMLSKRETAVLEMVALGFNNREIVEKLLVSIKSVETYRYRISQKLGFKSRADLVRFALEAGLLDKSN